MRKNIVAHALVQVEQGKLGAGVRAHAADEDPGALRQAGQVDQAGHLGELGALTQRAVLFEGGVPDLVGQAADRLADRLGD